MLKNLRNRFIKNQRYLCLIGVIFLGLMTIIGIGSGGANSVSNISLDYAYLQFRTYSDISNNQYRGWLEFTENGSSINESDITQIVLKDGAGNSVSIDSTSFYASSNHSGYWNSSTSSVEISGPYPYSGFSIIFPGGTNLSQGNYTYEVTTSQGNLLTRTVYFPGETTLPVVDDTIMSYEWLGDGGLRLTWTNPSGTYEQLRVGLVDQDWDDLLSLRLPNNVNDITIPSEWIQKIIDFKNPSSVKWQIRTWSYTDTGENNIYATGISDTVDIDMTSSTVNSTNPSNNATDVAVNTNITATFSEAMDVSTITTTTFLVNDGSIDIAGTVSYSDMTATFTPTAALDYDTEYTATITTGAKDLAGNALEANYTWSFATQSGSSNGGGDEGSGACFITTLFENN